MTSRDERMALRLLWAAIETSDLYRNYAARIIIRDAEGADLLCLSIRDLTFLSGSAKGQKPMSNPTEIPHPSEAPAIPTALPELGNLPCEASPPPRHDESSIPPPPNDRPAMLSDISAIVLECFRPIAAEMEKLKSSVDSQRLALGELVGKFDNREIDQYAGPQADLAERQAATEAKLDELIRDLKGAAGTALRELTSVPANGLSTSPSKPVPARSAKRRKDK